MPDPVFSDTLKAGTRLKRGNVHGQAYCTSYVYILCHTTQKKSEAHAIMSMIFKRDGVPPIMVFDNSKEQSIGKFAVSTENLSAN